MRNNRQKIADAKNTHPDKNLLVVNENTKWVVYLSEPVEGKMDDKKARG
ncbi:MAG: hypothetical protein M3Q78_03235 [Acidobacteriota bacterium]|nr:hypothetical protein [Acidobacteriota bacterium]